MSEDQRINLLSRLISGKDINKELTQRKQAYDYQSISIRKPELIKEKLQEGWQQDKEYKTTVKLRKLKSLDIQCEDKVWTLCALMGFKVMNKDRDFRIPFDPKRGLTQQIDVFAKDDETILIVECKSTEKNKLGDFKKDLEATAGQMEGLVKSIRALFPDQNLKFKYILATKNYWLGDQDKQRLKNLNGVHLDEESVEYYINLYKHLGAAARYQLLGSLFHGQEITGMDNQIPAIKGKMGNLTYYSFSVEPEKLLKISYVLHRSKVNSELMPTYQRLIKKQRLAKVLEFIDEKAGYFPNSIVISLDTEGKELRFDRANTQVSTTLTSIGVLHLPKKYRSAYIIDGQHRLYGYSNSNPSAAPVTHEDVERAGPDPVPARDHLGVGVDHRGAGVQGGVDHRLPGGLQDGADVLGHGDLTVRVAHHHDLDRHAVSVLDLRGGGLEGAGHRDVGGPGVAVHPRPEVALLGPGQRRHPTGIRRVLLDQRQRLEHRVVQVRGDVGPVLGAHPGGALLPQVGDEPDEPGAQDDGETDHAEGGGHHDVLGDLELAGLDGEEQQRGDQEPQPGGQARVRARTAGAHDQPSQVQPGGRVEPPLALGLVGLTPQHRDPPDREECRPQQRGPAVAVDEADHPEQHDDEGDVGPGVAQGGRTARPSSLARGRLEPRTLHRRGCHRQRDPQAEVEHHPEPEQPGEQEEHPHPGGADPEVEGQARADTAQVGLLWNAERLPRGRDAAHGP